MPPLFCVSIDTGECLRTLRVHEELREFDEDEIYFVIFSPDSKLLASASTSAMADESVVRIWSSETGECQQMFKNYDDRIESIVFLSDSKILVSATDRDKNFLVWSSERGNHRKTFKGHDDVVTSVTFSPDSKLLASTSDDRAVRIWSIETGGHQEKLEGHDEDIQSVLLSPDSKLVASVSHDITIRIWSSETGKCQQMFKDNPDIISSVVFSSDSKLMVPLDSKLVASASRDDTVRIWSRETGECQKKLYGCGDRPSSVALSPDFKLVAAIANDITLRIWSMETGDLIETVRLSILPSTLLFNQDDLTYYLDSNAGTIVINRLVTSTQDTGSAVEGSLISSIPPRPDYFRVQRVGCDISNDHWITLDGENVLWLRADVRSPKLLVFGATAAIGCASGRVIFIRLSTSGTPDA